MPAVMPQTVTGFAIFRSTDQVNYNLYDAVPAAQLYFEDHLADVHHYNYYYKVIPLNFCDIQNPLSNDASSILLIGNWDETGRSRLRWTPYIDWQTGVDHYILERMKDDGTWEEIKTLPGNLTETEDQ
jgi:hypothetical protein